MWRDRGAVKKKPPGSGEMPHFQGLRLPGADFLCFKGIIFYLAPVPRLNQLVDSFYCVNRNCFDFIVLGEIFMGNTDPAVKISFV